MFKSNIKALMEAQGKTYQDAAKMANIARQTLTKARTDAGIAECRLSTLKRIADYLGVSTKDLYDEG